MEPGATTPEELDALLEDAFITRDRIAMAELLEPGAVVIGDEYVARAVNVLQARDTALLVGERSISVALRRDCRWRFAIALLDTAVNGIGRGPSPEARRDDSWNTATLGTRHEGGT